MEEILASLARIEVLLQELVNAVNTPPEEPTVDEVLEKAKAGILESWREYDQERAMLRASTPKKDC